MKSIQSKPIAVFLLLAAAMAATRLDHFGSAVSLPDASYAVFFLGGLYLARSARVSTLAFLPLILEAGLIDFYATTFQGISDWCLSPAYWFLVPTYASLWMAGRWFALRTSMRDRAMGGGDLAVLGLTAFAASSFAFWFSNATFYLFSGRYSEMSVIEYASRVSEYYYSYVTVALLYIFCAVAMQVAMDIFSRRAYSV
jgi:hypothetical protein